MTVPKFLTYDAIIAITTPIDVNVKAIHLKEVHLSVNLYWPLLLSLANLVSSKPKKGRPSQTMSTTS